MVGGAAELWACDAGGVKPEDVGTVVVPVNVMVDVVVVVSVLVIMLVLVPEWMIIILIIELGVPL